MHLLEIRICASALKLKDIIGHGNKQGSLYTIGTAIISEGSFQIYLCLNSRFLSDTENSHNVLNHKKEKQRDFKNHKLVFFQINIGYIIFKHILHNSSSLTKPLYIIFNK